MQQHSPPGGDQEELKYCFNSLFPVQINKCKSLNVYHTLLLNISRFFIVAYSKGIQGLLWRIGRGEYS